MKSKLFYFFLFAFITQINAQQIEGQDSLSQEDYFKKVKRFSIGAKLGIPNLAGGTLEIVLPLLQNHIAPYVDYSDFQITIQDTKSSITYTEFGTNIYTNDKGNGFFVGLGSSKLDADIEFENLNYSENGQSYTASGNATLALNTFNVKVGLKSGGKFFFRFEVGYGFGNVPEDISFQSTYNGITEQFTEDIPEIPGLGQNGLLVSNIGLGFAF